MRWSHLLASRRNQSRWPRRRFALSDSSRRSRAYCRTFRAGSSRETVLLVETRATCQRVMSGIRHFACFERARGRPLLPPPSHRHWLRLHSFPPLPLFFRLIRPARSPEPPDSARDPARCPGRRSSDPAGRLPSCEAARTPSRRDLWRFRGTEGVVLFAWPRCIRPPRAHGSAASSVQPPMKTDTRLNSSLGVVQQAVAPVDGARSVWWREAPCGSRP